MNKFLAERFLLLLPELVCKGYAIQLVNIPNRPLGITIQYFYTIFAVNYTTKKENS